jgi:hypothetical protein
MVNDLAYAGVKGLGAENGRGDGVGDSRLGDGPDGVPEREEYRAEQPSAQSSAKQPFFPP